MGNLIHSAQARALMLFAIVFTALIAFAPPALGEIFIRYHEYTLDEIKTVQLSAVQNYGTNSTDSILNTLHLSATAVATGATTTDSFSIDLADRSVSGALNFSEDSVLYSLGLTTAYDTGAELATYEIISGSLKEPGTATIRVTFGNAQAAAKFGTRDVTITVVDDSIPLRTLTLSKDTFTYNATAHEPAVTVYDVNGDLVDSADYDLKYENNKNASHPGFPVVPTVTVTGKGRYSGKLMQQFTIQPAHLSSATVTAANQTYNGSAHTPAATVTWNDRELQRGEVETVSYANNVEPGMATVTVRAIGYDPYSGEATGNFTGEATGSFRIFPASITSASISGIVAKTYNGAAQTQSPTLKLGGRTLANGTDYTISYSNNVNVGNATITFIGKGRYTGTLSRSFRINLYTSTGLVGKDITAVRAASGAYKGGLYWANDCNRFVPGLAKTGVGGTYCTHMVPQGICAAGDYFLISAYCSTKVGDSAYEHDSVIYVIRKDGSFVSTLTVKGTRALSGTGNHFGGIAFDGTNVWIATSGHKRNGVMQELCIPWSTIAKKLGYSSGDIQASEYSFVNLPGRTTEKASFNTFYKGYLWVGTFVDSGKGTLTGYKVSGTSLTKGPVLTIGKKVNGAAFFEYAGHMFLVTNESPGRKYDTTMHIYSVPKLETCDLTKSITCFRTLTMPPMLEELCVTDGRLYTFSESASNSYNGTDDGNPAKLISNVIYGGDLSTLVLGQIDIRDASVSGIKDKTYTGSAIGQSPTVKVGTIQGMGDITLKKGTDYVLEYAKNTNVGTASVTIKGKGAFKFSITKSFKIKKAENPLSVSVTTKSVKQSKVKNSAQTVTGSISVANAKGKVTYSEPLLGSSSKLSINTSTGAITVKKGTKKGTYDMKVKVKAAGNSNFKAGEKTVTVKVKVT